MSPKSSDSLIVRFDGASGKKHLIECLKRNSIVSGDSKIASSIASKGEILEFKKNHKIITQDDADNDLYFLLTGSIDVFVNNRKIGTRESGSCFGEMAIIDPATKRSATIVARENVTVFKIKEVKFSKIAESKPVIWRLIASQIASRLRERNKYHTSPNAIPVIFIGSSSEALPIARKFERSLKLKRYETQLWSENVFTPSSTTIESLNQAARICDFALLILSPDDDTTSRKAKKSSPRDNVIFELGLFIGSIGRERTYILTPKGLNLKIPTDLLGVTFITYNPSKKGITDIELNKNILTINKQIHAHGSK
jgi:predicted nucleotide-binding protein